MKTSIGDVLLYASGQNPYLYQGEYASGPARAEALRQFRDSGALPAGIAAWSAANIATYNARKSIGAVCDHEHHAPPRPVPPYQVRL